MTAPVMLRCLTPFPQGTSQSVNGRKYHFSFNDLGHAVAQVLPEDVPAILSIGAGYIRYDEQDKSDVDNVILPHRKVVAPLPEGDAFEEKTGTYLAPTKTTFKQNPKAAKADAVKAKVAAAAAAAAEKAPTSAFKKKNVAAKKAAAKKTTAKA